MWVNEAQIDFLLTNFVTKRTEVATGKELFLKISQYSQKNTYVGVSF